MSNQPIQFERFTILANAYYTSIGLDAYEKTGQRTSNIRRRLLSIFFIFTIANMNITLLSELLYILMAFVSNNNFVEATMLLSFVGFVIVGDVKIYSIWRQRERISAMIQALHALYPQTLAEQAKYAVERELQRYKRFAYAFVLLHELLVWSYNLFPLLNYFIYEVWLTWRVVGKTLPYNCWTPFDWHNSDWRYYTMYLTQIAAGQACLSGQLANDLLLSAVAVQLIMHYRQLARRIEAHVADSRDDSASKRRGESANECAAHDLHFLRTIIAYHQQILNISQVLNDVFGISLFINFTSTALIICFVLFQITIGANIDSIIMLAFFLFCSLVQIFLICYYAQQLLEASEYISFAVYNHNWFVADLRYRKMLIFIMARAQKPSKLQATSLVTVSMSTMTDLLQLSYKGFAVIRTMYAREPKSVSN
ncbi:putative odorant receptor 85d [Zeugodacus cucurbitae]|uniref:putative odorant receptor 85d n=1 Tax=Zeugodacus cucurbitae TaxID=28588 RepID=UPI0005968C6A|nr:putative odorant receptor 85d [Zeugodacus cucurbitae]